MSNNKDNEENVETSSDCQRYFIVEIDIPTKLHASVDKYGNIKYLCQLEQADRIDSTYLQNEIYTALIKKGVYKKYSTDLEFSGYELVPFNSSVAVDGILASFNHRILGDSVYLYGYLEKDVVENEDNPKPTFIIKEKFDVFPDLENLHSPKCNWWSDWHTCNCK